MNMVSLLIVKKLKKLNKLGAKTYTASQLVFYEFQVLIDPLDATAIHPENYQQAQALLQTCHLSLSDIRTRCFKGNCI